MDAIKVSTNHHEYLVGKAFAAAGDSAIPVVD
jgi:hypothetical protein